MPLYLGEAHQSWTCLTWSLNTASSDSPTFSSVDNSWNEDVGSAEGKGGLTDFRDADIRIELAEMKREVGRAARWALDNGRRWRHWMVARRMLWVVVHSKFRSQNLEDIFSHCCQLAGIAAVTE